MSSPLQIFFLPVSIDSKTLCGFFIALRKSIALNCIRIRFVLFTQSNLPKVL